MSKTFLSSSTWLLAVALVACPELAAQRASATQAQQLPDPDGKPANMRKKVQVFILLGQSNMLGFGHVGPEEKDGTLQHAVAVEKLYPFLVDDDGA